MSPAVSVVVLALLGAGVGFVRSGRGPRWCLGNRGEAPPLPRRSAFTGNSCPKQEVPIINRKSRPKPEMSPGLYGWAEPPFPELL